MGISFFFVQLDPKTFLFFGVFWFFGFFDQIHFFAESFLYFRVNITNFFKSMSHPLQQDFLFLSSFFLLSFFFLSSFFPLSFFFLSSFFLLSFFFLSSFFPLFYRDLFCGV